MLLENRVLWGGVASVSDVDPEMSDIIATAADVRRLGRVTESIPSNVVAIRCTLTTSVQYTRAAGLLEACAVSPGGDTYAFEFLCATLKTAARRYCCFLVPFRTMVGGVLQRIDRALRGRDYAWHRLRLMPTVEFFRARPEGSADSAEVASALCGLDLHILAARGEQEIVFVGMNPARSRVFAAVTDRSGDFTLSPISATFSVGPVTSGKGSGPSYITMDRRGVVNVSAGSSFRFLRHMLALLQDFETFGTLMESVDRPVYKSRNAHKRAILASISA